MKSQTPLVTALRIARVSSPALTNAGTAVTSLVLVPLLEVALIVAVSASLGGAELVITAYAGILLACGTTIINGTIGQITRDRQVGVLLDALTYRFFYLPYWLGKVAIPVILAAIVAIASALAVFALDPATNIHAFAATCALIPLVAAASSLAAVGIATLSLGLRDPYLLANIATGVLPLTAGVIVPISTYPTLAAWIAHALPFTAAIEALRAAANPEVAIPSAHLAWLTAREILVCLAWLAIGATTSRRVIRSLRNGRRSEDIW